MTSTFEPALVSGIIFSDSVIREHGTGKCSFIGSFQVYNLPQFPFQVPPFFVTAIVTNLAEDLKTLDVTIRIENPQNSTVLASPSLKANFTRGPKRHEAIEISLPVAGVTFPAPGIYSVVVLVNNEKVGERVIQVQDIKATVEPQ